jgi:hypothetical protein
VRPFVPLIIAAVAAGQAPGPDRAPSITVPVKGATVTVVENSGGAELHLTVENHRDSPLVEWHVDSSWFGAGSYVAVAPHARGTMPVPIESDRPATRPTVLSLAVFEDGYYEGYGRTLDQWVAEHTQRVDDLRYWVDAFMSMPRISIAEMRRYLADHIAECMSRQTHEIRHVSDRVQELLRRYPEGPYIARAIDDLRKVVEAELIVATRTPPGDLRPGRVDAVTAATVVSAEMAHPKSYSVVIENLRDVSIEAYSVWSVDPATGRDVSGMLQDLCSSDPSTDPRYPGRGRIQPYERRDLHQHYGPAVPVVRLKYVMFDDLVFEGDAGDRERLLRDREQLADEYAFALATLAEAVKKPPAELEPFLIARRQERLSQQVRDGKMPVPWSPAEQFVRTIRQSSPEQFLADADATRKRLDDARRRLTRHLSSTRH